jgi:hypothetical protein
MRLRATRLFAFGNTMSGDKARVLYHASNSYTYELDVVSNWYLNVDRTTPATSLPTAIDTCHLLEAGYYPDETNPAGTLFGSLTCAKLYIYGTAAFEDTPGIAIYTPEIYIIETGDATYIQGWSFPITTIIDFAANYSIADISAPLATMTIGGSYSNVNGTFDECILDGEYSYFSGFANFVNLNGQFAYAYAEVSGNAYLWGNYSYFNGICHDSLYANGDYTFVVAPGIVAMNIYLNGYSSLMDYDSICYGNVYMSGESSYLQSTAYIAGDVYYNPLYVADPTGSAVIDGTVYPFIP